jgi:hypothetical protein
LLEVAAAKYLGGHRVRVRFNNGEEGVVDLTEALWGLMFEPLTDPAVFERFTVSKVFHTLCWENGADLAPEYLYAKMQEQSSCEKAPSSRR